MQQLATAEDE